jgi:peroxiredoxin
MGGPGQIDYGPGLPNKALTEDRAMAVETPICDFGWSAPPFALPGIDGRLWTLDQVRGPKGTLIMFICNHCPYVQAVADRMVRDANGLRALGIGVAAIMSNDVEAYPEDGFDNMKLFAARHGFAFPYLYDESQQVARAYDAVCTPDFFGFDADLGLQYRGRLDESRKQAAPVDVRRDLFEAMRQVAETGRGPVDQIPSMGCSIKWRSD